jgi:hypothetical protein
MLALVVAAGGLAACEPPPPAILWAVGDVARCGGDHPEVAALLAGQPGNILGLGDLAYGSNPARDFANCYDPWFGQFRDRMHPAPGNHEYSAGSPPGAYLSYFGAAAAPGGATWYSFDAGGWHIVSLDSNCGEPGMGCGPSSPQYRWLAADLARSTTPCLLAYWHHPPFASQTAWPGMPALVPMMLLLQSHGLDVLLSSHVHNYERFGHMGADGRPNPSGFRAFVVGTGGASHHGDGAVFPGSEVRNDDTFGALRLDLAPNGYTWQFVPVAGSTFTDRGMDSC